MDSLTQCVLGAAVGEILLGKRLGYKAQLLGAVAATIPDLDVIVTANATNDLTELLVHRSYSHSLLVHVIFALPFAYITYLIFKKKVNLKTWYLFWFLGFSTHALLDNFTTYGTQLLMPITNHLFGFNNISIIDPLFTFPFFAILIYCLCLPRESEKRNKWAWRSIYYSLGYLLLTFVFKFTVHQKFKNALIKENIIYNHLSTSPTIFNSVLWSGIAANDSFIYIGEFSLLQKEKKIPFQKYKRNLHLLKKYDSPELNTLLWFSQGLFVLEEKSDTLHFYITKWGRMDMDGKNTESSFRFYYKLYKENDKIIAKNYRPEFKEGELGEAFSQLWKRIWSAN